MDNENKSVSDEFTVPRTESSFLRGSDFDGGLDLTVVRMEKFTPADAKYGVSNTYGPGGKVIKENWFVKNSLLEEGQSFKYTFKQGEDEKSFDNSSLSFYFAFIKADLKEGDKVNIKREKISDTKVDWTITKE